MKRFSLFVVVFTLFSFVATTEGVMAQITLQLPGFKVKRNKSPRKSVTSNSNTSNARWYASVRDGVDVAMNGEGVMISIDDSGELIFVMALKYPSGKKPGTAIPVEFSFNGRQFGVFDAMQLERRLVGLSGSVVYRLVDRFKRSRKVDINVAGNTFSTRLSGSTRAIKKIEKAAKARRMYLMDNVGKVINDASVKYMMIRHKKKTMTVATNQVLNNHKRDGIRNDNVSLNKSMRQEAIPKSKVQYFVPGTRTTGEMWINSDIVAQKGLVIKLNFVDPGHPLDKVSHTIQLLPE